MANWNPWHGCHKLSAGCEHCYVYRMDERHGKDASTVTRLKDFDKIIRKNRSGEYKIKAKEIVYTCFTSDFFVEDADVWRKQAWDMIRERQDLFFFMITKRIDRFLTSIPDDWNDGWDHVAIACTVENMDRAAYRLPIYKNMPIRHKFIVCEPILEVMDLRPWLDDSIEQVIAGGESGHQARVCRYEWILDLRRQCEERGVSFWFKQTGANFIKDGIHYHIPRKQQHHQARKAGINLHPTIFMEGKGKG